ncbi:MAG: SAM-dependent methyltransferase [Proteobacteria bacterium]|nr:SAM-dependent methyltransferase [Pseudomonadota bacterium]
MQEAMFNEASGYYRTQNPIGKDSDFITSPEISQVFGELIAAYFLQVSSTRSGKISLVEMGAGRGILFFDILRVIKKMAEKNNAIALDFLRRTKFHIIEINEVLVKIQQKKLSDFEIKWHKKFEDFLSEEGQIFFISNELFDCFPIDQFVNTDIGWCERMIGQGEFVVRNFDPKIHQFVQNLAGFTAPFGAIFEHSESAHNFMNQLCEALKIKGGIAINFDYGYEKSEFANTLQSVKNHQKNNIFENVGNSDLTAHVDFGALDKIAKSHGLASSLVTQSQFLTSLGIEERRKKLPEENSAIDRLIAPDQMGELFKSHIIWK